MPKIPKVSTRDMWRQFVDKPETRRVVDLPKWDALRSCKVKASHATKQLADVAVSEALASNTGDYVAYRCRHCPCWHIGHRPGGSKSYTPIA